MKTTAGMARRHMQRKQGRLAALPLLALAIVSLAGYAMPVSGGDRSALREGLAGFVEVNGVRLQYLDWGGSGPALILIHGLGDNPHKYDDLAPAFTDRFRVIAYARRGAGASDKTGPYDVGTLTEDLRGLMDALGIAKADLVGQSSGGDEITEMAIDHPDRVRGIVYLDGVYDYSDPEFRAVEKALPTWVFGRPANAMASLDAFRAYEKAIWFSDLDDMQRVEAFLRGNVVTQSDGKLVDITPKEVEDARHEALHTNKRRDYLRIHCPTLALVSEHALDVNDPDPQRRKDAIAWEENYWRPFQTRSVEHMRRDLKNAGIVTIPGRHVSFWLTYRQQVVREMNRFFSAHPSR